MLSQIEHAASGASEELFTSFDTDNAVDRWGQFVAIPKFFDFNARLCGSHIRYHGYTVSPMVDLYVDAMQDAAE